MLSISDMHSLRRAYSAHGGLMLHDALSRIGNPSDDDLVRFAVSQMANPDRNARVLMLRVLRHQRGERAMQGVLAGLHDPKRRVCAVAIRACPNYLDYAAIVQRLEAIARDDSLKRKLRRRALSMLAGNEGRLRADLSPAVSDALARLMLEAEYRFSIVFGLVRLDLTPRVSALLRAFADSEDARERQLARRALGSELVIHIDAYAGDAALHHWIRENGEIAHGRMFYWIPRTGIPLKLLA